MLSFFNCFILYLFLLTCSNNSWTDVWTRLFLKREKKGQRQSVSKIKHSWITFPVCSVFSSSVQAANCRRREERSGFYVVLCPWPSCSCVFGWGSGSSCGFVSISYSATPKRRAPPGPLGCLWECHVLKLPKRGVNAAGEGEGGKGAPFEFEIHHSSSHPWLGLAWWHLTSETHIEFGPRKTLTNG